MKRESVVHDHTHMERLRVVLARAHMERESIQREVTRTSSDFTGACVCVCVHAHAHALPQIPTLSCLSLFVMC